ncbi:MAG: sugar phosphate isomerase/epimerase family protein [Anaerolineae bacterium]
MKCSYMLMGDPRADDGSVMDWRLLVAQLAREGLQGVDVFASYLQKLGVSVDECLAVLSDNGLAPAQFCLQTDFITAGADVRRSLDMVKAGADICVKHGIRQLFSAGGQHSNSGPEAMSRYVDGLQQALDIACAAGLGFSIENAGRMCHTWEELLECVTRVGPGMCVTLDGGNFILAGSDPHVAAEKLGSRVVHVHVKNFVPAPDKQPRPFEYCPPARGLVDYPRVVGTLVGYGFDGYLSFEPEGWPNAPAADGVRFCCGLAARFSKQQA